MEYPTPEEASRFAEWLAKAHACMTGGIPDAPALQPVAAITAQTQLQPFFMTDGRRKLFAVQSGIPWADAHNTLVVLMSTIHALLDEANESMDAKPAHFAACYLVEMATGIVNSLPQELWVYRDRQSTAQKELS